MIVEVHPLAEKELSRLSLEDLVERVLDSLENLENHGIAQMIRAGEMKKVRTHGLYEIKVRFSKLRCRVLGFNKKRVCFWVLSIFVKKTRRLSKQDISTAVKRKRQVEEAYSRYTYISR